MRRRILVVDDSSIMRKMISEALETQGHEIIGSAHDGKQAVTLYKSLKPDLVIMDVTMQGADGFFAAKEILDHNREANIIFLSNLDDARYTELAFLIGAKGFFNKNESKKILEFIDKL